MPTTTTPTALITGAGRRNGLGFHTAKQLGALGFHVILGARDVEQVATLAADLTTDGIKASAVEIDLVNEASVAAAAAEIGQHVEALDVLVNNAAMMIGPSSLSEKNMNELLLEFHTNVIGAWSVTKHLLPLLSQSGHGRVVNVSSGAGSFWDPDYGMVNHPGLEMAKFGNTPIAAYGITKAALNALTVKMAKDLCGHGILVNSVCPGVVATRPGTEGWARPVSDGAASVVWAATLTDEGPTGQFFRDGHLLPW